MSWSVVILRLVREGHELIGRVGEREALEIMARVLAEEFEAVEVAEDFAKRLGAVVVIETPIGGSPS